MAVEHSVVAEEACTVCIVGLSQGEDLDSKNAVALVVLAVHIGASGTAVAFQALAPAMIARPA